MCAQQCRGVGTWLLLHGAHRPGQYSVISLHVVAVGVWVCLPCVDGNGPRHAFDVSLSVSMSPRWGGWHRSSRTSWRGASTCSQRTSQRQERLLPAVARARPPPQKPQLRARETGRRRGGERRLRRRHDDHTRCSIAMQFTAGWLSHQLIAV